MAHRPSFGAKPRASNKKRQGAQSGEGGSSAQPPPAPHSGKPPQAGHPKNRKPHNPPPPRRDNGLWSGYEGPDHDQQGVQRGYDPQGKPQNAREAVCRRLATLSEDPRHPNLSPLDVAGLEAREAALARAIYRSSVARWNGLMHLIGRHLKRPWRDLEPELRGALMAGGAQLLFLEGVAPHAAVHETVAWVKRVNPKASGLVNAVLRRLSEDIAMTDAGPLVREQWTHQRDELPLSRGGALVLNGELLPAPPPERLEVATGVPRWQITQWIEAYGLDQTVAMCAHSLIEPPVVLRTAHAVHGIDAATPTTDAPEDQTTVLKPHSEPGHHVMVGSPPSMELWLAQRPGVWVQDASSSRSIGDNASLTPGFIVDLCAGQGTKTRQLAATFPDAKIVATDIDQRRMRTLAAVFADHPKVEVVDAERIGELCARKADLVLADVPCSNSGVLPRRGEARLRLGENQLRRLVNDQRTVLDQAHSLLGRGGMILYATCSLEPAENRGQADWAVKTHGMRLIADRQTLPEGSPGGDPSHYRDGAYWALLGPAIMSDEL